MGGVGGAVAAPLGSALSGVLSSLDVPVRIAGGGSAPQAPGGRQTPVFLRAVPRGDSSLAVYPQGHCGGARSPPPRNISVGTGPGRLARGQRKRTCLF